MDQQESFDKMGYRLQENEYEDEQSDRGSVSLTDINRFQSDRREGYKTWRQMQANHLKDAGGTDDDDNSNTDRHHDEAEHNTGKATTSGVTAYPFDGSGICSSISSHILSTRTALEGAHDGKSLSEGPVTFGGGDVDRDLRNEKHYTTVGTHASAFGNLPDPIRLSEQTGEFDGQVVFIGHPNRDVSAHQWSSSSFQWVNIGRYAKSRGKVEGSLASDRLRGTKHPHDTLEYFKLAAENRQTLVVEHGRSTKRITAVEEGPRVGTDVEMTPQSYRDPGLDDAWSIPPGLPLPSKARNAFTTLEDPFVAVAYESILPPTEIKQGQGKWPGLTGSLDLTYRFPNRARIADNDPVSSADFCGVRSTQSSALSCVSKPVSHEVAFGEEAATQQADCSTNNVSFRQLRTHTAYQSIQGRVQHIVKNEDSASGPPVHSNPVLKAGTLETAMRTSVTKRPAIPVTYQKSALSATAMPYARIMTPGARCRVTQSHASTINAAPVDLHYSDPDALRTSQPHEVANDLNQQAPTRQTFEGPFFTESKPTTHDPTAALAVRVSDEEKLMNWFRDGHRPARQREYTKSLIVAATAHDVRHLGAARVVTAQDGRGPYANTAPFVRLYENLSEYVEEYRNGRGHSYFTRGWKPASPQARGVGVDSIGSYFSKGSGHARWPRAPFLRPSERPIWG